MSVLPSGAGAVVVRVRSGPPGRDPDRWRQGWQLVRPGYRLAVPRADQAYAEHPKRIDGEDGARRLITSRTRRPSPGRSLLTRDPPDLIYGHDLYALTAAAPLVYETRRLRDDPDTLRIEEVLLGDTPPARIVVIAHALGRDYRRAYGHPGALPIVVAPEAVLGDAARRQFLHRHTWRHRVGLVLAGLDTAGVADTR
ncbi:hypothetical protein [Streptomyces sp. NPDC049970]|uniref:hypothetical protein n=1 Tax=Streptomyces sp. NPDC049970 TaxID=3155033 RepID=UPI00344636AF